MQDGFTFNYIIDIVNGELIKSAQKTLLNDVFFQVCATEVKVKLRLAC